MPGKGYLNRQKPFKASPFITREEGVRRREEFERVSQRIEDEKTHKAQEQDARDARRAAAAQKNAASSGAVAPNASDFAYHPPVSGGSEPE